MSSVMQFAVFAVASTPVILFLWFLSRLQRGLKDGMAQNRVVGRALLSMPFVVLFAPSVMFAMMCLEHTIDPDFAARSFENPEIAGTTAFYFFALDQTAKGGLFDFAEAFKIDLARLDHKCDSRLFCGSILIYRTVISSAVSVFVLALLVGLNSICIGVLQKIGLRRGRSNAADLD